jgi:rubrerythrin
MNLFHIFDQLEKQDADLYERLEYTSRRKALRGLGQVAAAALPAALGSLFQKAYGQAGTMTVLEVLNYALTLEHLEYRFYDKALMTSGLIPAGAPTGAITTIRDHELAHVKFLQTAISASGGTPVAEPTFDFTAGNGSNNGPFAQVYSSYPVFLAVAQAFEDTGVRAYKGQAANLISNGDVLTAALNIHSVEARHAAHIRYMRRNLGMGGDPTVRPWISFNETGGIPGVEAVYAGEEVTNQAGIDIAGINGISAIGPRQASESFDEPLTSAAVLAIVDPFIV